MLYNINMKDSMKLILAIVSSEDANKVQNNLNKENVFCTRLSTKGGFLREENATFVIGIDSERVDEVLQIIKEHSRKRTQMIPGNVLNEMGAFYSLPSEISIGGATVFILDVEQFLKL
ncbi:MAG: transcriptional regulator [Candidatus Phytoplasma pruni]|nr:MAG: transcriptional regulator [Candidatus Phytoplasma pruni]